MTLSHGGPSMNIDISLCAAGAPRSRLSILSMRPSKVVPVNLMPKSLHYGCILSGTEPKTPSVESVPESPCTNPNDQQNQASWRPAAKGQNQRTTAEKHTTAPNSPWHEDTNRSARLGENSGTPPRGTSLDDGANNANDSANKKAKNGTTALSIDPSSSSPPTTAVLSSKAPQTGLKTPSAPGCITTTGPGIVKSGETAPPKCSMLTISSALCNDNFTVRRERRDSLGVQSAPSGVNNGGKARYQERFAPLRPTDRSQIEALQRRRRRQEETGASSEQVEQGQALQEPACQQVRPPAPAVEPPSWAVPAAGEARLEPVCESLGVQDPIDLTSHPYYRVGRSPGSDVQLLHATSSRRHALLFHHPNGSCYVVDCGSAHGTYVNGVRVPSASGDGSNTPGVVVPHRVRRGALIRFGGPGAPCFVLKSFSVGFESLVRELPGVDAEERAEDSRSTSSEDSLDGILPSFPSLGEKDVAEKAIEEGYICLRRVVSKEGEDGAPMAFPSVFEDTVVETPSPVNPAQSEAALVQLNTRLNALGGPSHLPAARRRLARRASAQLFRALRPQQPQPKTVSVARMEKRSRDPQVQSEPEESNAKRIRTDEALQLRTTSIGEECSALSSPKPAPTPTPAVVSPLSAKLLLSPDMQQVPPPPLLSLAPTPIQLRETLSLASSDTFALSGLLIPSSKDLKRHSLSGNITHKARKVRFSDDAPQLFYPVSVTPDELSADEGDIEAFALPPTPPTTPRAMLAGV